MSEETYSGFTPTLLWQSELYESGSPLLIAGPCSAESRAQLLATARELHQRGVRVLRAGVWKPRTFPGQFEGIGEEALLWLIEARDETGMLVGTEIGSAKHAEKAIAAGLDYLWIGARTTSSPFAVQEIADALKGIDIPILLKNPLNPSTDLWKGALYRLIDAGAKKLALIHRGFDIGVPRDLRNAPLWGLVADVRKELPSVPIYLDPSHIAGRRDYLSKLIQIAYLLKYDGIMIESHLTPDRAWSDRNQQITPTDLANILSSLPKPSQQHLQLLRDEMDGIDERMILLLSLRRKLSLEIGDVKRNQGFSPYQEAQYYYKRRELITSADVYGLPEELLLDLYQIIHDDSVAIQK